MAGRSLLPWCLRQHRPTIGGESSQYPFGFVLSPCPIPYSFILCAVDYIPPLHSFLHRQYSISIHLHPLRLAHTQSDTSVPSGIDPDTPTKKIQTRKRQPDFPAAETMPYLESGNLPASPDLPSPSNTFEELVQDLSAALGPSSGLDSDDVDPCEIQRLMERYSSNPSEWLPFALGDHQKSYTRNLIDEGNGKSNLVRCSYPIVLRSLVRF